ncbi:MAG: sugar porter family MFS transporter [Cyclobacteriaceae bacterium]
MRSSLLYYSIVVALAGFLFGFDTVVISGADEQLQLLWNSSNLFHGFVVMSMALWGTVVGALFGHIPTDSLGRRKTLIWIGFLYLISAVGSSIVSDPYTFSFFRFIGGLGVGASTIAAPAYISEIAPKELRGKLVALYQFNIVFGILVAFVSNYFLKDLGENAWRGMIGAEAIPALIYIALVFRIPASPRWLILKKGNVEKAKEVFRLIGVTDETTLERTVNLIAQEAKEEKAHPENLFQPKYRKIILLAFLIAFFNQASGINAILYYAPRIMAEAGLDKGVSFLSSIGIGLTNLVFTLVGLYLIDLLGRKVLMYIGSIGYIVSLSLVSLAFFLDWTGMVVPVLLFVFIGAHAIGQGTVIWVFISEIFPNHLRAKGQSFGSSIHWIMAALITIIMPPLLSGANPGIVFMIFACLMVLQLLFVWVLMPETKGVSLEDIQSNLINK